MASDSVVAEISETVSCISWAPGKDLLIAGSWDSSVYLYDIPEQASYVFFFFSFILHLIRWQWTTRTPHALDPLASARDCCRLPILQ